MGVRYCIGAGDVFPVSVVGARTIVANYGIFYKVDRAIMAFYGFCAMSSPMVNPNPFVVGLGAGGVVLIAQASLIALFKGVFPKISLSRECSCNFLAVCAFAKQFNGIDGTYGFAKSQDYIYYCSYTRGVAYFFKVFA